MTRRRTQAHASYLAAVENFFSISDLLGADLALVPHAECRDSPPQTVTLSPLLCPLVVPLSLSLPPAFSQTDFHPFLYSRYRFFSCRYKCRESLNLALFPHVYSSLSLSLILPFRFLLPFRSLPRPICIFISDLSSLFLSSCHSLSLFLPRNFQIVFVVTSTLSNHGDDNDQESSCALGSF